MPQKEPLPQNGGTTPPAPETAQSGRLLMHVLRLHRKARVGFFENLLLPCAAPAAPADPKAVRQKGEGGLTRRKKRRAAGASCRAAFFRTSVRRRMRETQSVRQRTESAVGSPVRGRDAVSSRRHAKKKHGRFDGARENAVESTAYKGYSIRPPLCLCADRLSAPRPCRSENRARRARFPAPPAFFRRTGPPPERASRRRQSETPGGFVQNGH